MTRLEKLYLALVATFVVTFVVVFTTEAGLVPTLIVGGSMAVAAVIWGRTSLRRPPEPRRVLPIYLIVASLLMLHITEEYVFHFGPRVAVLTGATWSEREFLFSIGFWLPVVWISGAALIALRHPIGGFVTWFIFVGMIFGEPAHLLVFPIWEGGRYHYFPGMWTALIPLVPAVWGMWVMVDDYRHRPVPVEPPVGSATPAEL